MGPENCIAFLIKYGNIGAKSVKEGLEMKLTLTQLKNAVDYARNISRQSAMICDTVEKRLIKHFKLEKGKQ